MQRAKIHTGDKQKDGKKMNDRQQITVQCFFEGHVFTFILSSFI